MALPPGERVTVGLVRGLHGLRGAVRVEVLSDAPARFAVGSVLFAEGEDRPLIVDWTGPAKHGLLVRFRELTDRSSVEGLRERYLEAVSGPPLPAGTWYWHEILGLEARTSGGEVLGTVSDVFRAGEAEVYTLTGGPRGEILVPAVESVVVELRPEAGFLIVDQGALALDDVAASASDVEPADDRAPEAADGETTHRGEAGRPGRPGEEASQGEAGRPGEEASQGEAGRPGEEAQPGVAGHPVKEASQGA